MISRMNPSNIREVIRQTFFHVIYLVGEDFVAMPSNGTNREETFSLSDLSETDKPFLKVGAGFELLEFHSMQGAHCLALDFGGSRESP